MAEKASKLDAPVETRCLIHRGTVVNQLLALLKEAEDRGKAKMDDPSLTISWPTVPGKLADNTMVFASGATITLTSRRRARVLVFRIEGNTAAGDRDKELSLTIHAVAGEAWVPPQS